MVGIIHLGGRHVCPHLGIVDIGSLGITRNLFQFRSPSFVGNPARPTEAAMIAKPSKEKVRHWLLQQIKSKEPPPNNEEIRRQLGWQLIPRK